MSEVFYWIGVAVVAIVLIAAVLIGLAYLYANLIHDRFGLILFRKTPRRISLASWHESRMLIKDEDPASLDRWPADDWPVAQRPFLLSYRFAGRSFFIMAGIMQKVRHSSIEGTHP